VTTFGRAGTLRWISRFGRARRRLTKRARATVLKPVERVNGSGVYLTFDDGPDPCFTPQVLDLLDRRGHQATFFMLGASVAQEPQLAREIVQRGHAIGSHSASHPKSWEQPFWPVLLDYVRGHRAIARVTGERVRLFRPPYGHDDLAAWWAAVLTRSRWIHWTCDPFDWEPDATADDILKRVGIPEPGMIVLLHDRLYDNPSAIDRSETIAALERLLDTLDGAGLRSEAIR
jgi:peptidoglycan/xylan/chitin deacetylase (PgdA/CDA1 family)